MSVPYERYEDEIQIEDHERSASESDPEEDAEGCSHANRLQRAHALFNNRWPKQSGISQLVVGFLLALLGLTEVIIIPLAMDTDGSLDLSQVIKLNHANCWGIGIWTGLVLSVTGSLAIRASVYKSICTVYSFFVLVLLDTLLFTGSIILCLTAYSRHWTTRAAMQNDALFGAHVAVVLMLGMGFLLVVHAFTQYYEDVFCGELQMCKRSIHCCCPCWCPPPVAEHELLHESAERPPSLPV